MSTEFTAHVSKKDISVANRYRQTRIWH